MFVVVFEISVGVKLAKKDLSVWSVMSLLHVLSVLQPVVVQVVIVVHVVLVVLLVVVLVVVVVHVIVLVLAEEVVVAQYVLLDPLHDHLGARLGHDGVRVIDGDVGVGVDAGIEGGVVVRLGNGAALGLCVYQCQQGQQLRSTGTCMVSRFDFSIINKHKAI